MIDFISGLKHFYCIFS